MRLPTATMPPNQQTCNIPYANITHGIRNTYHTLFQAVTRLAADVADDLPMPLLPTMMHTTTPKTANDETTANMMLCPLNRSTATDHNLSNSPPLKKFPDEEDDFDLLMPTTHMMKSPTPLPKYYISDFNATNPTKNQSKSKSTIHWDSDASPQQTDLARLKAITRARTLMGTSSCNTHNPDTITMTMQRNDTDSSHVINNPVQKLASAANHICINPENTHKAPTACAAYRPSRKPKLTTVIPGNQHTNYHQPPLLQKPTTHWIHDTIAPVVQAVNRLAAAFADLSNSIMATVETLTSCNVTNHFTKMPTHTTQQALDPQQTHHRHQKHTKHRQFRCPPLPNSHPHLSHNQPVQVTTRLPIYYRYLAHNFQPP